MQTLYKVKINHRFSVSSSFKVLEHVIRVYHVKSKPPTFHTSRKFMLP